MSQRAALKGDPFFGPGLDRQWNACLGKQGHELNYVDGYMEAALELADSVIEKRLFGKRDTLVLPILYNARHAVELTQKFVIRQLQDSGLLTPDLPMNHDILQHWKLIRSAAGSDEALRESTEALAPYIESLAKIDVDGQELRYAENRAGGQSLKDHAIANLQLIRSSLAELHEVLTSFKYRTIDLANERRTGTYTSACSRRDLMTIATMLPSRSEWGSDAFQAAKALITKRFDLSGRKFSEALDVIEKHPEMGCRIGIEFELSYLSDEHVILAIEQWSRIHPPVPPGHQAQGRIITAESFDMDDFIRREELDAEACRILIAALSIDELAELETVYYIGRDRLFSEDHPQLLRQTRNTYHQGDVQVELDHVMEKSNFPDALVQGITTLGRPKLAAAVRALRPDCVSPASAD